MCVCACVWTEIEGMCVRVYMYGRVHVCVCVCVFETERSSILELGQGIGWSYQPMTVWLEVYFLVQSDSCTCSRYINMLPCDSLKMHLHVEE